MHLALTLSNSCSRLAVRTNLTPCLANATAMCSPIPLEAPVIKTTFPFKDARTMINLLICGQGIDEPY